MNPAIRIQVPEEEGQCQGPQVWGSGVRGPACVQCRNCAQR